MKTTRKFESTNGTPKLVVTTEDLQSISCGRSTAVQIGESAEARVQIGRRVLWNVSKISTYVNMISY